jgi:7-cyano-7-deazaguanine synthase
MAKSVVLLSGGVDSALCLAYEVRRFGAANVIALVVDYGQRHQCEIAATSALTRHYGVERRAVSICPMPTSRGGVAGKLFRGEPDESVAGTSPHYVPARNTVLLSLALCCAESSGAERIVIGATQADHAGFPDCRPHYFMAWQTMCNVGTATQGRISVETPLGTMSKTAIGRACKSMKVPLAKTWSCYRGDYKAGHCGECDACINRLTVCVEAGVDLAGKPSLTSRSIK